MSVFTGIQGFERGRGRGRGRRRGRGRSRGWGRGVTSSETNTDECTEVTVQSVRRGLTGGARELCERYIWGTCYCPRVHHQKKAPYVWQYLVNIGDWKLLSNSEMEIVEESFCDNDNSTEVEVRLHGEIASTEVNFEEILDPPGQTSYNKLSFRRLSTRSYVEAGTDEISHYTQWVWYWQDNSKEWSPFIPPELQLTLETKYLAGQNTYLYTIADQEYRLDFTSLVQVNRKTLTRRPVQRRPMFVSLDDARSCQQTCSSLLMSPATVPPTDVSSHWAPLDRYQNSEKVELNTSSDEFTTVMSSIYKTLSADRCQVQRVYRLQNALLCLNFLSMKRTLQVSHSTESIDERHLFHGTDTLDVVDNICINNFDFRVSGKNATMYGKGAYFARDAKYSHCYTKGRNRYMFLARVLVGKYALGDSSYTRPPPRKGHVLYDSCVNDINNPSIFVIFERNQCYPEYLVEYRDESVDESVSVSRSIGNVTRSPASASAPAKTAPVPSMIRKPAQPVPTQPAKVVNPASSSGLRNPSPSLGSVSTHGYASVGSSSPAYPSSVSTSNRSSFGTRAPSPVPTLPATVINPPASSSPPSTPRYSSASVSTYGGAHAGSSSPTYPSSDSTCNTSSFRTRAPSSNQAYGSAAGQNTTQVSRSEIPVSQNSGVSSSGSRFSDNVAAPANHARQNTPKTKVCILM
ncbi:protein mono-ADP-ribosyltransferase PARP12-like [Haliotis rubra]|uniref:protein mono-ADP-ribosyltransferase PARP12-like n=1 Tax=Haliotis rubra TaxID=36100 RepID=UPI001EE59C86|nr:protein mono-ADP-ribosyltransferase PARP12-like [Haliotis rubra]